MVGLGAACLGCGTVGTVTATSPQAASGDETTTGDAVVRSAPPSNWTVEVVEPGAAPRRALRFQPAAGSLQRAVVRRAVENRFGFAGAAPVTSSALVSGEVAYSVDAVADGGFVLHVACRQPEVTEAEMSGPGRDALDGDHVEAAFGVWSDDRTGCGDRLTISTRYEVLETDEGGGAADALGFLDQLDPALRTAVLPLPTERVGVGARWTATSTTTRDGVAVNVEGEAELVALEDEVATVVSTIRTDTAGDLRTTMAGRPVDLRIAYGRSSARLVYRLDEPVPTGEVRFTERLEARVDDDALDSATGPVLARHAQDETITIDRP